MKYTDNVRFNYRTSIIFFIFYYINFNIQIAFFGTIVYLFASAFFQPDLDLDYSRPGMTTFPIGFPIKNRKIKSLLNVLLYPINRIWYYFWHPYGQALTHRGISHYPIIGTFTRFFYIQIFIWIYELLFKAQTINLLNFVYEGFFSFNKLWIILILPVFISDIIHFLVDYYDSIKNGTRFSSYAHKPGIILQIINPKIMKFHKRALKSAKKNAKK